METVADKLPEREAIILALYDEGKTMATMTSKSKAKEKVKITRRKREPRCGCKAAARKK